MLIAAMKKESSIAEKKRKGRQLQKKTRERKKEKWDGQTPKWMAKVMGISVGTIIDYNRQSIVYISDSD